MSGGSMSRKYRKRSHKHTLTKHHRLPRSVGGTNHPDNISYVPCYHHEAWHTLFSNLDAPTICAIINQKWLDPNYEFVCRNKLTKEIVCVRRANTTGDLFAE